MRPARRQAPSERQVRQMFDGLVERYDLLNTVLSLGLDRVWRRAAARAVPQGGRVLDLGCGTGALGQLLADRAVVVGVDVSHHMLLAARRRRLLLVEGSAFALPFPEATFDAAVSGFVLRNLDDLTTAFGELARVLRPRGTISLVDITEPAGSVLRRLFDAYFGTVAPALGAAVGKRDAYRYLVNSLSQLPPAGEIVTLLHASGFQRASARSLTGGMVTLFTAHR